MELFTIHTTYMELRSPEAFVPAYLEEPALRLRRIPASAAAYARWLYTAVGWTYQWDGRAGWDEEAWVTHLARTEVAFFALFLDAAPVGLAELNAGSSEPGTELAHLGILESYQGRGFGKHLLSVAVARTFEAGATWVWLHTDNFDGPHAVANYRARGFVPYRLTTHQELSYPPGEVPAPPRELLQPPPLALDAAS